MNYEKALELLQPYMPDIPHNDRKDFEAYKQQLLENLGKERRYRSTETLRNERSMIIEGLNTLALQYVNQSFTDLAYGKSPPTPAAIGVSPSSTPTTKWNIPAIRELLTKAFNDEQFSIFCYDHFRTVFDQFAIGSSKTQKIQWLIEYCDSQGKLEHLLELIKQKNRYQYHQFESSLRQG